MNKIIKFVIILPFSLSWDAETFVKIAGLLNLTAVEIAKESGCSPEAVRSARMGRRPVSEKLEKFMIDKLREASGDAAVQLVLETCSKQSDS